MLVLIARVKCHSNIFFCFCSSDDDFKFEQNQTERRENCMDEEEFLIFMQKINKKVEIEEIFKRFPYFLTMLLFVYNFMRIYDNRTS